MYTSELRCKLSASQSNFKARVYGLQVGYTPLNLTPKNGRYKDYTFPLPGTRLLSNFDVYVEEAKKYVESL